MTMDTINGCYEIGGALVTLLSIQQLLRDRCLMGAHWGPTLFFTGWGLWNLAYYPSLHQPVSTIGAALLVAVNAVYLGLMLRYRSRPGHMHFTSGPGPDFGDPRCGITDSDRKSLRRDIESMRRRGTFRGL